MNLIPNKLPLSPAEEQVFRLTADGLNSREVAAALNKHVKTVDAQKASIKAKLGMASMRDLLVFAFKWRGSNK